MKALILVLALSLTGCANHYKEYAQAQERQAIREQNAPQPVLFELKAADPKVGISGLASITVYKDKPASVVQLQAPVDPYANVLMKALDVVGGYGMARLGADVVLGGFNAIQNAGSSVPSISNTTTNNMSDSNNTNTTNTVTRTNTTNTSTSSVENNNSGNTQSNSANPVTTTTTTTGK